MKITTKGPWLILAMLVLVWVAWRLLPTWRLPERPSTEQPADLSATAIPDPEPPVGSPTIADNKPVSASEDRSRRNWRELFGSDEWAAPKLTAEEIGVYLAVNHTNAASLMIAFQATSDREYLRLAATNFPNNPFVQYNILAHDLFPEARAEWTERFKQRDAGNSLANYISARDLLKQGNTQEALQELMAASQKSGYSDFTREKMVGMEEAYLEAGYPPAEAKLIGTSSVLLPSLAQMKDLGRQMAALQQQYAAAGDSPSADAMVRLGIDLGRRLDSDTQGTMINQLVGLAIEKLTIGKLDPNRDYDFLGGTVAEHLAHLDGVRNDIHSVVMPIEQWIPTATDADIIAYADRLKVFGEVAAVKWLKERLGAGQ